ncbi:MAG TPA: serine protease [Chloroflexota bacterium]|nr:serine protease [Chloroflexota bacterium]
MSLTIESTLVQGDLAEELAALAREVSASVVVVQGSRNGAGSGVVWNSSGLIITNAHVVSRSEALVIPRKGERLTARVVAYAQELDLAALQLVEPASGPLIPARKGDSRALKAGDVVVAVGNPLGERNAATLCIVGGPSTVPGQRDTLRLAIALRPGNSGGALADVAGRIVGIPHMVIGRGLALAVPTHVVEEFLTQASRQ